MSVLNENTVMGASAAGGYEIDNSLRFNDDDSAYLSRTPASAGNRKTWTWSGWVKLGDVSTSNKALMSAGSSGTVNTYFAFNNNRFFLQHSTATVFNTSGLFRDPSAWYHVTLVVDTSNATAADRVRMYMNGELQVNIASPIALNTDTHINDAIANGLGRFSPTAAAYFDGYLAEVNFIDGQALTPDSFGETGDYGEWIPKAYAGARGTNGFYLDFKDSGSLGNDAAGSNNWTPTNLAATDQMLDSPTNNFAVCNVLTDSGNRSVKSEGNLRSTSAHAAWQHSPSSISMSAGKWYSEMLLNTAGEGIAIYACVTDATDTTAVKFDSNNKLVGYKRQSGNKVINGTVSSYGAGYNAGDIIGMALDMDAKTLTFYKNNVSQGTISSIPYVNAYFDAVVTDDASVTFNFGQDSSFAGNKTPQGHQDSNGIGDFYYAPPTGFLALCTKNLPEPTVVPSENFSAVTWTADGTSMYVDGVGFQTDLSWHKSRSHTQGHSIGDSVQGFGGYMQTNSTSAAYTGLTSIAPDADGFTSNPDWNTNGYTYAAWNWKAGGTGVSNTDGTITSTVSANVDAGFSIVSYTGNGVAATVGHGLSQRPDLIITKGRSNSGVWPTWHKDLGGAFAANAGYLYLNGTGQAYTTSVFYDGTGITSSVYKFRGGNGDVNQSSRTYISYAFHSVDGYSKVGSYSGNGSSDGPMVYTGFRPAFVMIKRTDAAESWSVVDTSRNPSNYVRGNLYPSNSNAEDTTTTTIDRDMLSNGFKLRATWAGMNASGGTYIYYAIAESPFKHSNAR